MGRGQAQPNVLQIGATMYRVRLRKRALAVISFVLFATACTERTTGPSDHGLVSLSVIASGSEVGELSLGGYHSCALKTDGTVVCWGASGSGQVTPPAGLVATQISVGSAHTCAVKTDGVVSCWGSNGEGQSTVPAGVLASQVGAGFQHTCAVRLDTTVVCWGDDFKGQSTPPVGLTSVAGVIAGIDHSCALKLDGTVVCWGSDFNNQLHVPPGLVALQLSGRHLHTCALLFDATPACWGYGPIAAVPAGILADQISGGNAHTCVVRPDATVRCWGFNGDLLPEPQSDYGQTIVPPGLVSVAQVSSGGLHTCAVKTDGTVVCWGRNLEGQALVPPGLNLITNQAPEVSGIVLPLDPVPVVTLFNIQASFADANPLDTHTGTISWDDGSTSTGTISESAGAGTVSGIHGYASAGVYTVGVTVDDGELAGTRSSELDVPAYVVIYDPDGGFTTGGGWYDSPAGAFASDQSLAGRANFGFVSKYKRGASVPTGKTEFQFRTGDLEFHSETYDWLIVNQNGHNAQFRGTGTINGAGAYRFMIWAGDNNIDTFRIRITDAAGLVVYDNGVDQPINGGSIVIHTTP